MPSVLDPETGTLVWDGESLPAEGRQSIRQSLTDLAADLAVLTDKITVDGDDVQIESLTVEEMAVTGDLAVAGNILVTAAATIRAGNGSPEGAVTGSKGDIFLRLNGGAGTTFYVKESGTATNTGWAAK